MKSTSGEPIQTKSLGAVRLHKEGTHETILVPQPMNDPNDPLNWSPAYKYYLATLTSATLFLANFLNVGPAVAMVEVAVEFFRVSQPEPSNPASLEPSNMAAFQHAVKQTAYFYSCSALMQGMSNLFYMPFAVKYGRRPIYIASFVLYLAGTIWASRAQSYTSELIARILMGWGSGSAECVAPLTISDIFFLHERGKMMGIYTIMLSIGAGTGSLLTGLLSLRTDWRVLYYIGSGLLAILTLLIIFTMPETTYHRVGQLSHGDSAAPEAHVTKGFSSVDHVEESNPAVPAKKPWRQTISFTDGNQTDESLWLIFWRPVALLVVPPVFWATLVFSVNFGFAVVISTSVATSFSSIYHFKTWQIGLVWMSNVVGGLLGLPFAGALSEHIANVFTRRNGGVREAEMRLPTMIIGMIMAPIAVLVYGLGLHYQLHWMVPTVGLGIYGFSLVIVGNVVIVYCVDAFRPIAGEVVVTEMSFKAAFSFLIGFYVNPWIERVGYAGCFGTIAALTFFVYAFWIPLFFWGKGLRVATMEWKVMKFVDWSKDREVGE